jgi:hypothetical protein
MIAITEQLKLPEKVRFLFQRAPSVVFARKIEDLEELACGGKGQMSATVAYELGDGRIVYEVDVVRVRNGISANYREPYMRRRDPNCMVVADERPSDKVHFNDRFGFPFDRMYEETLDWLGRQHLAVFAFQMGQPDMGGDALAICPANAGFFAFGLGLLQGIIDLEQMGREFEPSLIIYVAPPFRHTHFDGKQVVVHRRGELHEIFSYNLYPGPSAKKGVYGALIELGEQEGWVTAHCSTVQAVTPYDNIVTFMHEGASGGGKSEMLQQPHRMADGRLLLGKNVVTGEERYLEIPRTCDLHPVCDDMGLCHPSLQEKDNKLYLTDAENAWFLRVDQITEYGTDPELEKLTIHPSKALLFLNIESVTGETALIWNHIQDNPGIPCPNPRVVVPRSQVENAINDKVPIDFRSFGIRTPPCTAQKPTYGILGLFHMLPPALAWLWRLVSPRGFANPSIVDTEIMSSEGVGSYWPFTAGKQVAQANLLLQQFRQSSDTRYILVPNQHVGSWRTGFMPQWIVRDYLARRGHARFPAEQIVASRCPLLGYSLQSIRIEGLIIPRYLLQVDLQPEVGTEAFDEGARILTEFFHSQIQKYMQPELDSLGREIIDCCLSGGTVEDYGRLVG